MELDLLVIIDVNLKLVSSLLVAARSDGIGAFQDVDPTHSYNFIVDHKSKRVWKVALISDSPESASIEPDTFFNMSSQMCDILREYSVDFDKSANPI